MKQYIEQERSRIKKTYMDNPKTIILQYGIEIEKTQEYNGRQILELLQNADDEAENANQKTILISVNEDKLLIANNGQAFTEEGVDSLLYSHSSSKAGRKNKIGHKGTGFRSILNWANAINIKSHDLSIEFSRQHATRLLDEIIAEKPQVKETLSKQKDAYPIATLVAPVWLDTVIFTDITTEHFDTYIVLSLKQGVYQDIVDQLEQLDIEDILFMQNTERLIIETKEKSITFTKEKLQEKQVYINQESLEISHEAVKVTMFENREETRSKVWTVNGTKGIHMDKEYEIKVAFTKQFDDDKDLLYSFFRTNVSLPFPALIHGTFELNGNRNQINDSANNRFLMGKLIDVLIETATMIARDSERVTWDSLRLLSFDGRFDKNLEYMGFKKQLIEKVKASKLFPTKAGMYISYDEQPIFYDDTDAQYLPEEYFPNLTIYCKDYHLIKFLSEIGLYKYNYKHLCNQLSKASQTLSNEARAHIVKFLLLRYGEDIRKVRPPIFIDENDELISDGNEIFLPLNDQNIKMPDFVSLRFLNTGLCQSLINVFQSNARSLWYQIRSYNIHEYKPETVIKKMVSQTTARIDSVHKHKGKYVKQLLGSLFDMYISIKNKNAETFPHDVDVPMLNRHNQVMTSNELYFGREYWETVTENLFKPFQRNCFIGSPKMLGLSDIDKEEVKKFLSWIGIKAYPRIFVDTIYNKEYERHVYQGLSGAFPLKLQDLPRTFEDLDDMLQYRSAITLIDAETVHNLDQILAHSSSDDIIVWLIKCKPIHDLISTGVEQNMNSAFSMRFKYRQDRTKLPKKYFKSYILWRLQNEKWLQNQQKERLSPHNFCFTKAIQQDVTPFIQIPDIDVSRETFRKANITYDDVAKLLGYIGIGPNMANFSTETVYSILNGLCESESEGRKAKAIYKLLFESRPKIDKSADCYKSFMAEGKVLAQKGDKQSYETVTNVFYLPHRMYCKDILKNFYIFTLDKRIRKSRVKETLAIQPFEGVKYDLLSEPVYHDLNHDFQLEFEELKPYFYMDLMSKDSNHTELEKLKHIKVSLCTDIQATYTFRRTELDFTMQAYEMIVIDKTIMIKLEEGNHSSIDDLRHDLAFRNQFTGAITDLLGAEESRLFFREMYGVRRVDRDDQIIQVFEDEELLLLSQAKMLMGSATNPCKNFWLAVLRTKKIKTKEDIPLADDDFKQFMLQLLHQVDHKEFEIIYDSLDYEDINSTTNIPLLRKLFRLLAMTIERFNSNTLNKIDLSDYVNREYNRLKMEYKHSHFTQLYAKLTNASISDMQQFVRKQLQYENFDDYPYDNSFDFDVFHHFELTVREKFGLESDEREIIDLSAIYRSNFFAFENFIYEKFYVRRQEIDAFLAKAEYKSLLFFKQLEFLFSRFEELHRERMRNTSKDQTDSESNKQRGNPDDNFQDMFDYISKSFFQNPVKIKNIGSKRPPEKTTKKKGGNIRSGTGASIGRQNEDIGYRGETFAYLALCNEHGKENVEWVSENAYRARVNANGTNNLHYDLKYKDKQGIFRFVEVKTSVNAEAVFNISKEEVSFGETNKDYYEILLVLNVNDEAPEIWRLNSVFKYKKTESFRNNARFRVENSAYKIRFVPQ